VPACTHTRDAFRLKHVYKCVCIPMFQLVVSGMLMVVVPACK